LVLLLVLAWVVLVVRPHRSCWPLLRDHCQQLLLTGNHLLLLLLLLLAASCRLPDTASAAAGVLVGSCPLRSY
jgi:hypothetical protein